MFSASNVELIGIPTALVYCVKDGEKGPRIQPRGRGTLPEVTGPFGVHEVSSCGIRVSCKVVVLIGGLEDNMQRRDKLVRKLMDNLYKVRSTWWYRNDAA